MTQLVEHDLSRMDDLSIDSIQKCLRQRYERDLIYTNIKDILIAINPRKPLAIYDEKTHDEYNADKTGTELEPHIFQVAATAYRRMLENDANQVIIVSGESGAGKTESTKYMVKHMVHMCQKGDMELHDKIVKINPLLEAFGNAKTIMNDNSSRYAKYLELGFKDGGELAGAVVRNYMLEKSRVVRQNEGEGNFHIFYALFAGRTKKELDDLFLKVSADEYRIMQSVRYSDEVEKYKNMYLMSMDILGKLGVDKKILAMLAAVIHIADIKFEEGNNGAAQIVDAVPFAHAHAANLLDLDESTFRKALISSKRKVKDGYIATHKTVKQANDGRDALAKMLYDRMFGWLVRTINQDLHPNRLGSNIAANIGILDIAGFEKLENNSFEQLCINLVNEKLQNFMNQNIFTMEEEIYREEGIPLDGIDFKNNDDLLAMFETPKSGVLAILDENSNLQQASDEGFVQHLKSKFGTHVKLFKQPPGDRPIFCIQHFAALVPYNAEGFVEKNRDRLNDELMQAMSQSKNGVIRDLFTIKTVEKQHVTLVSFFQNSLMQLLQKLGDGDPFFVRCIKANSRRRPDDFDEAVVTDQLRYNGFSEIAKIRKMGFAVRKLYSEFVNRYRCLFPTKPPEIQSKVNQSLLHIVPAVYHRDFRCGETRIFMTTKLNDWFELKLRNRQRAAAETVTRCMRKMVDIMKEKRRKQEEKILKDAERRRRKELQEHGSNREGKEVETDDASTTKRTSPKQNGRGSPVPGTSRSRDHVVAPPSQNLGDDSGISDSLPPSPVVHHDEKKNTEKEKGRKENETAFWDVCKIIDRERKFVDVDEDRGLQVIKVVTYILLFCILLWCAVSQKLSLMVLVSLQYKRTANRTQTDVEVDGKVAAARHILLTVAIVIPYCMIFFSSIFKWLFGNLRIPGFSTFILCSIVEIMHSIGLCSMCFVVLPEIDMVCGIFLLNGVVIIPALFFPICASNVKPRKKSQNIKCISVVVKKLLIFVLDIATVLIQFGYILVVLLFDYFVDESKADNKLYNIVLFVVAMILVSFSWWENFIDDRFCGRTNQRGCWRTFILKAKFDLQESRPIISTCTSFAKICLTILFSWLIKSYYPENQSTGNAKYIADVTFSEAFDKLGDVPIDQKSSVITLTLAAFIGHYVGYMACKLKLQRFSFNIPLIMSTPLAVIIAMLDCTTGLSVLAPFTSEEYICREEFWDTWYHYLAGIVVLISLYWLCRHIFYPNIERLAKSERLSDHNSKDTTKGEEEDDDSTRSDSEQQDIRKADCKSQKLREVPMIYACATMWHETEYEMLQLMKSLFRMDLDQCKRKNTEQNFEKDKDFYDYEAHIFFDDAMTKNNEEEMVPNDFVKLLTTVMDEAASCVHEKQMILKPPIKFPTPYGGQLKYTMPGDNFLFVHLKDKKKIRHKKRWSQVMYMYYLLGFRITNTCEEKVKAALESKEKNNLIRWEPGQNKVNQIFHVLDDQVLSKANNTFLLALDGDVDFSPGAVRLLLDRMRKSEKVGAACGRIHPIGKGPVVWFQKFEYAIAHWLQKSTEHVLGCVLCSPGCFSMFRGMALMDDNVMKKYTILPTEAAHHLMYDQGEDRWLCTLLLQQGYRVDYAAGSDAFTYAPEGFAEFFNQRRRWMPSTVLNIIDLLADYKNTVYVNPNISMLYIFYQGALLMSTILGPATVLMMIAGANMVVFKVTVIWGFVIALAPAVFYFVLCFYSKSKTQIKVAEILTGLYAFVMMIVLVGTVITAVQESPLHPSVIFLGFLVVAFVFSAFLHPKEWPCIVFGALYFILIPTGFLLLNIYSICNLHDVSWGTRDGPKNIDKEKNKEKEKKRKKHERGLFGRCFPSFQAKYIKHFMTKVMANQNTTKEDISSSETNKLLQKLNDNLKELNENIKKTAATVQTATQEVSVEDIVPKQVSTAVEEQKHVKFEGMLRYAHTTHPYTKHVDNDTFETAFDRKKEKRDDLVDPAWAECKELGDGKVIPMKDEELKFWKNFIHKYLQPLDLSKQKETVKEELIELRNNIAIGMAMINLLWIAVNFMFQFQRPTSVSINLSSSSDPDSPDLLEENQDDTAEQSADNIITVDVLGMLFIFFYLGILLLQFIGMIMHRWGTFQHLISVTKLKNPFQKFEGGKDIDVNGARNTMDEIPTETERDYSNGSTKDEKNNKKIEGELENLQKSGTRYRSDAGSNVKGTAPRRLGEAMSTSDDERSHLSKRSRIIRDGIEASRKPHSRASAGDTLRKQMQLECYQSKDKNVGVTLPPIRHKRLNLMPVHSELVARLKERNPSVANEYFNEY